MNADTLSLLVKNKLCSRLTGWLLLTQEHDAHLNHVDGTSNLFANALPRIPRLDDAETYDCDNKILCKKFCFTIDNETQSSNPSFALDLVSIDEM